MMLKAEIMCPKKNPFFGMIMIGVFFMQTGRYDALRGSDFNNFIFSLLFQLVFLRLQLQIFPVEL